MLLKNKQELKKERRRKKKRQLRINQNLKFKYFNNLNYNCYYCKNNFETKILTIEHIIPLSKGGTNDLNNITLACKDCNQKQGKITFLIRKSK